MSIVIGCSEYRLAEVSCLCADGLSTSGIVSELGVFCSVGQLNDLLGEVADLPNKYMLITPSCLSLSEDHVRLLCAVASKIDRHAIVSPTLRFGLSAGGGTEDAESCDLTYRKVWRVPCDCALVGGEQLMQFGFFDPSFSTVYASLCDFALRINDYGYSALVLDSLLLSDPREAFVEIEPKDEELLGSRFPHFFEGRLKSGEKQLAKLLDGLRLKSPRPSILFEFSNMRALHCGTSEYQLAILEYFEELYSDRYEIRIRVNDAASAYHRLRERFKNVYSLDEELPVSDVGFVAAQPIDLDQQIYLSAHCLRIVYTMLDCILLRSGYLAAEQPSREDIVRQGLRCSDGIVAISQFSENDYRCYFHQDEQILLKPFRFVYIATDFGKHVSSDEVLDRIPFGEYSLVVGNSFKHKALLPTIEQLKRDSRNYVVVGVAQEGWLAENVYGYPTSNLGEAFLNELYRRCECLVFPSQYEGFGLPITIALKHGKPVVLHDNELNRELGRHFPEYAPALYYFGSFEEIVEQVKAACCPQSDDLPEFSYSWRDAVIEIESFLAEILDKPVDPRRIEERAFTYRLLGVEIESAREAGESSVGFKRLIDERFLQRHPRLRAIAVRLISGVAR